MTVDPLVMDLLRAKDTAGKRGLWRTLHAIDDALQQIGWELAERKGGSEQRKLADQYLADRTRGDSA